jgi:S1-C subfamily serine protease
MRGSHRKPWRYLLALTAAAGLALATAPAHTAPAHAAPAAPDPASMVAQVGPTVVDINTEMGYADAVGAGTGIVLDPGGAVLTNNHVVSGATALNAVAIVNGQPYDVDVIGYDRSHDVAVVQLLGAFDLPAAAIGNSSTVAVGDPVIALGNAGGQGGTPSAVAGHVIGLNETISATDELTGTIETLNGMIHADTPIRSGDSGGPMVNAAGQVIGMNTAASENFQFPQGGEGYAIPINQAMAIARQIRAGVSSDTVHIGETAFLGVGVVDNPGGGARVERVLADTPAAEVGVEPGDVITAIDGAPVNSATALTNLMDRHHPGDVVELSWRGLLTGDHSEKVLLAPGPVG